MDIFTHLKNKFPSHPRPSSHLPHHTLEWPRGIDIPLGDQPKVTGNFRHLLVHQMKPARDKEYACFIKPEDFGVKHPVAFLMHAWGYIAQKATECGLGGILGQEPSHAAWFCKEHIDLSLPECQRLIQLVAQYIPQAMENTLASASIHGVKDLFQPLKKRLDVLQGSCKHNLSRALEEFSHMFDHPEQRMSREVILSWQEIQSVDPHNVAVIRERLAMVLKDQEWTHPWTRRETRSVQQPLAHPSR